MGVLPSGAAEVMWRRLMPARRMDGMCMVIVVGAFASLKICPAGICGVLYPGYNPQ